MKQPWTQRGPIGNNSWLEVHEEIDAALDAAMRAIWDVMELMPDEMMNPNDTVYPDCAQAIGHLAKARVANRE